MEAINRTCFCRCGSLLLGVLLAVVVSSSALAGEAELDKIRQAIQNRGARWVAGQTSVSGLTDEEKSRRLGLIKPFALDSEKLKAIPDYSGAEKLSLSPSFDWRDYGGKWVTAVRDQGSCGSCWAFAVTAALESHALIYHLTPNLELDLAEQILVSCSSAGSCDGGYIDAAAYYLQSYGLPVESCFPYKAGDLACNPCVISQPYKLHDWHWAAWTSPSVETLKTELYNYGPLVTTMDVHDDFFSYRSGVYSYSWGSYRGGHAVVIVGYDDTNQCFIVKNSWGKNWGESGYFRIAYSEVSSYVNFGDFTIRYEGIAKPGSLLVPLLGVLRGGRWFFDFNRNKTWDACAYDLCYGSFGIAGDRPVAGNWTGEGYAKIGVYRNGAWYLDRNGNGAWDGCGTTADKDICYSSFGIPGDLPVAGDWTDSGYAKIGVYRNGTWYLDRNGNGAWDGCGATADKDICYASFGSPGDLPVAGDWTGDGYAKIGVYRNGTWYLDRNGNGTWDGCGTTPDKDICYSSFGIPGDLPVAGDWTGDGKSKIGVYRNGAWYLDWNGNGVWDGCGIDYCLEHFGASGDLPLAGRMVP